MSGKSSSDLPILGFSEQQRNKLVDILNAAIQKYHRNHLDQLQQDPGPGNNFKADATPVLVTKELNPEEEGFFDQKYEGNSPVINAGKNVFYREVYPFVDRLQDMKQIKREEKLRLVVPQWL